MTSHGRYTYINCILFSTYHYSLDILLLVYSFIKHLNILLIYFWLCWVFMLHRLSRCAGSRGYCLVAVCGLLIAVASLTAEHRFQGSGASVVAARVVSSCNSQALCSTGSIAVEPQLGCSAAWGIWDQGLNPCLLHWQMDSLSLSHQGSLLLNIFNSCIVFFLVDESCFT